MAHPQSSLRNSEARPLLNPDTLVDDLDDHNDEHDTPSTLDEQEAERQLVRKVDKRMSILVLIYILNYMDRNNAGAARLRGFEEDLHLEGSQFATILSVLYISYVLMQIPSNMFLNYYKKPSMYLPWCMVIWGVLSLCMGSASSYHGVLLIRFLLGFAEAAYFPGALFLLTKWYKKSELSERTAILSSGILLSNAFGSLVASAILDTINGFLGYAGWRWLFFVEGVLTIGVAFWSMVVLPDFPENSDGWLTQAEKTLAVQRMARDAVGAGSDVDKSSSQWQGLSLAVHDWKVWWLAVALWSLVTALSYGVYFPTIAATMGFSATVSLLLCAPPWLVATYLGLKASRHSDQRGERFIYIAGSCGIGILGFAVAALTMNSFLRYISMFAMAQMYIAFITFLAWTSGSVSHPPAKRAVALALINCVSQAGNVIGSYIWPSAWGPSYSRSFCLCILLTLVSVGMCAIFRQHLRHLNEQAELEAEETGHGTKHKYML